MILQHLERDMETKKWEIGEEMVLRSGGTYYYVHTLMDLFRYDLYL